MKYALRFDKDALIKAALLCVGAALAAFQTQIPTLGFDPTVAAVATLLVAAIVAAISRAEHAPPTKPA